MLSKTIEIMIIAGIQNHVYKFGNEIRKQKEGVPIGLSLKGEVEKSLHNWLGLKVPEETRKFRHKYHNL